MLYQLMSKIRKRIYDMTTTVIAREHTAKIPGVWNNITNNYNKNNQ